MRKRRALLFHPTSKSQKEALSGSTARSTTNALSQWQCLQRRSRTFVPTPPFFVAPCFEKQTVSSPSWQRSHEEIPALQPHHPSFSRVTLLPHLPGPALTPGEPLAPFLRLFFLLRLLEFHPKLTLTRAPV